MNHNELRESRLEPCLRPARNYEERVERSRARVVFADTLAEALIDARAEVARLQAQGSCWEPAAAVIDSMADELVANAPNVHPYDQDQEDYERNRRVVLLQGAAARLRSQTGSDASTA